MTTRALLAFCGLLLAAAGVSAQLDGQSAGLEFVPRFSRLLKQDLSTVQPFLLPNKFPEICIGAACCQADSYASPYELKYLNRTQEVIGGRTYTTFFYTFNSGADCMAALDGIGCCSAGVETIWVDVDPSLKVKYVSFDGQHVASAMQGEYGLRIGSVNMALSQVPTSGLSVEVTVEGAVDVLCPPPGLAPMAGLCEIVVMGKPSASSGSCCPISITRNSKEKFIPPEASFQCNPSMEASGFKLVFDGALMPQTVAGVQYASYSFRLVATETCNRDAVDHCCDMQLSYLELKVTDLPITAVQLNGQSVGFSTSAWNEPNSASYRALLVENLKLVADDVSSSDLPLAITVRLPSTMTAAPDLCDASSDPEEGACSYYLHTEDGFCCPSGLAVPTSSIPEPPAGTCAPLTVVPASETSMSLQYYEQTATTATTTFTFLLANHNSGPSCGKTYCEDVCSWTLFLNPAIVGQVAIGHEDAVNNGKHLLTGGTPASITFTYGPSGESADSFFLTLPGTGKTLSDLCARNILLGQNGKACSAIVRSKDVYFTVFFDETDRVIWPISPTGPSGPALCPNAQPMASSCLSVQSGRFNMQPASSVYDFRMQFNAAGPCQLPSHTGQNSAVHLLLTPAAVDQISTRMQVSPSNGLSLDRTNGATWTMAPMSQDLMFQVQGALGVSEVCHQGLLPDQPAGSCVAEVSGDNGCFRGYVAPTADGKLIWIQAPKQDRSVDASTVVPAVVVPVVVLLIALIIAAILYRRRRSYQYAEANGSGSGASGGSLERPLAGDGNMHDDLSVASAAPSDVHIRVPGASQGGASIRT